jgi:hypothetical protein
MATAGANERLVRMFYKEIVEPGRTDLLETFAEADMLDHGAAGDGVEAWSKRLRPAHCGGPRWRFEYGITVDDLIADRLTTLPLDWPALAMFRCGDTD